MAEWFHGKRISIRLDHIASVAWSETGCIASTIDGKSHEVEGEEALVLSREFKRPNREQGPKKPVPAPFSVGGSS